MPKYFCSRCKAKIVINKRGDNYFTNHRCKGIKDYEKSLVIEVEYKKITNKYSTFGYLLPDRAFKVKKVLAILNPEGNVSPKSNTSIKYLEKSKVYRAGQCSNCGHQLTRTDYGWLHFNPNKKNAGMECNNKRCKCKFPVPLKKGEVFKRVVKAQDSNLILCRNCGHEISNWGDKWLHSQYHIDTKECRYGVYHPDEACSCKTPATKSR